VKQDRVVVITGAAGGIGSVLVDRFLANGDTVIATDATKEHLEQLVSSRNAGQRLITSPAEAEDLVGPVFFLASPDSDFISGQILNVDGGMTTH
jgi:NAD(P)-dependent dehydrogenase (short-subunit alcohol dehydrogenase family)